MKKKPSINLVGIDTNLFIYYFTDTSSHHLKSKRLFSRLVSHGTSLLTSSLTVTELLSLKADQNMINILEERLVSLPNLSISDIGFKTARIAADIRRKYGFQLADSIQLATAILNRADIYISNDLKLKKFKELEVITLNEL